MGRSTKADTGTLTESRIGTPGKIFPVAERDENHAVGKRVHGITAGAR
ncbi:MAG: hypothetical protein WCE24_11600 [Pseudolabrys sp.]